MNAPLVWDLAGHLAKRLRTEVADDETAQVNRLYMLALSRPPRPEELEVGLKLLAEDNADALRHYCHLALGLNEMIYVN